MNFARCAIICCIFAIMQYNKCEVIELTIGERIKARREQLGFSVDEVARKLGKNRATIYRYESDYIENLPVSVLEPIASILETTPAFLMGWEKNETGAAMSSPHIAVSSNERYAIMKKAGGFPVPQTVRKPLLGNIACGEPITAIEDADEYVEVPKNIKCDFVLHCKGDSMIGARIYDGDLVYIRIQPDVEHGEIAAVMIDGETTLKRVRKESFGIVLWPENPNFTPLVYSWENLENFRILGKAVAFTSVL